MFYVHQFSPKLQLSEIGNRIDYYLAFKEARKELIPLESVNGLDKYNCLVFVKDNNNRWWEINRRINYNAPHEIREIKLNF